MWRNYPKRNGKDVYKRQMFVCPSILDTVSMGTPFDSVVVVALSLIHI